VMNAVSDVVMMYCSDVCGCVCRCVTDSATDTVVQYGDEYRGV
jgi:hypothetical protein